MRGIFERGFRNRQESGNVDPGLPPPLGPFERNCSCEVLWASPSIQISGVIGLREVGFQPWFSNWRFAQNQGHFVA